ncbi:MAG: asparagine synthetase B family protein [Candidatus Rokuibacteriota bacterium]
MIAGLVRWDRATDDAGWVRTASRRFPALAEVAAPAPVRLLATAAGVTTETSEHLVALAELDLTNVKELQALTGHRAHRGRLLTALYALEGPRFVRRLRGGFALALWDRRARTLVLAVDHFGIKRLHYAVGAAATGFGSRASALLGAAGVDGTVDPAVVYEYLNFGYVPAPASIYRGVRRLPPGHLLVVRDGRATVETYWDLEYAEQPVRRADAAATVYRLAEEAVAGTVRETPSKEIGAFLSGGTDSSTIVGLTARLTGERPNAFSIGFREDRYDELEYAELAARHFGAAHYTTIIEPAEALATMSPLVDAYDEPFGNNSAIGTLLCARLAGSCGVSVLLAGDGGDEIFGGNERYRADRVFALYHRLPAIVRRGVLEPVLRALPDGGRVVGRAQRYVRRANLPNPRRFYSYEFFFVQDAAGLLAPDFRAAVSADAPYAAVQRHWDRARATSELNRQLYLDMKLTIGDSDLLKVTRTAELAGVDVRFPMLDVPLVEYMGTVPARYKVRGFEKRHLFKRAFRSLLPAEILAKVKHGFGVPTSLWLRQDPGFRDLARDALLGAQTRVRPYFAAGALERLFALHATDVTSFYGDLLWRVLMLELWSRRHAVGGRA